MNNALLQRSFLHPEVSVRAAWWLGLGWLVVVVRGLFLDVMDVDASQYASMAMEMSQNGSWLQVQHRGADYLDKPPLLFWLSAVSFNIFGIHNWSYKLPSMLAAMAGIYAVYRFGLIYYKPQTARNAAMMLAFSLGLVLLCNDVRTDTLLLGFSACAAWMLAEFMERGGHKWWIGAFVCIGFAMLAKGPIGLVATGFAAGTHVMLRRDWKNILRWQWLAGLGVALLVLAPMCWGLYQQFDLHPEKEINGRIGVSGLYFFFWEQSFGRITGENVWKNDTPAWYFVHVYLWAFLPWCLLLIAALVVKFKDLFFQKFKIPTGAEAFSLGGFVLTFAALSMSKYKLPHYVFITLPWAAVLAAAWLESAMERKVSATMAKILLAIPSFALFAAGAFILFKVFPGGPVWVWVVWVVAGALWLFSNRLKKQLPEDASSLTRRGAFALLAAAFVLNFYFYPNLLPYQQTAMAPRWAAEHGIPAEKLASGRRHGHAFDFYAGRICPRFGTVEEIRAHAQTNGAYYLYADDAVRGEINAAGVHYEEAARFGHFQVALLKPMFLDPGTRTASLRPVYLLKIFPEDP
ncbi:MAG: glycosyltransferase family 39 protein [Saprospiraceae bacterium]|nr:glycosyltransferase family 39 protein [Saprospiraceae bacterium]